jgi:phosphatidylglycerophosphate synthase
MTNGGDSLSQPTMPRVVVLDLRGPERPRAGGGPLALVCGLPVVVRSLLVLERAGYARALLLVHPEDCGAVKTSLRSCQRLRLPCSIAEDQGGSLAPVAGALGEVGEHTQILFWPATLSFGRRFPLPASCATPAGQILVGLDPVRQCETGMVLADAEALRTQPSLSLPALLAQARRQGICGSLVLAEAPVAVVDRTAVSTAERALLRSLRKDADGVVAKFDRYLSLATSRRLMALPVKPNHVTIFAALVGILCGLVTARGGYGWMLLGALGFQANSILDGIDGEIARAKLLESSLGQWLDTVADDISNLAFMVGVSVGCYRTWGSQLYLALGVVAGAGFLLASALMYHYIITRVHSGDLNDFAMPWEEGEQGKRDLSRQAQGSVSRFLARIKCLVRRDAYVLACTLCGILGQLRIMAWLFAVGATATWTSIVAYRTLVPLFRRTGGQRA